MLAFQRQGPVMLSPAALSRSKKREQRAYVCKAFPESGAPGRRPLSYTRYPETPSHNSFTAVSTSNA
jgi:hypothetical protein